MASESSQTPSSSRTPRWTYDVFLSFRGEDTRLTFTDHLHAALKQKGIMVFRDDEKLKRGEFISKELSRAICESEYAVVVISKRYAFSKWCLIELTKIVECMRKKWLTLLPIFYGVKPSDVRKLKGLFAEAFDKFIEAKVDEEQLNSWRDALEEVGKIAGWDVWNRYESEVVEGICTIIRNGLTRHLPNISRNIFGIEPRVEKMMTLLRIECEGVRFLGICGMGGAGKTTLAEVIYDSVSSRFENSCFIANVREKSRNLVDLQQQILLKILKERREIFHTHEGVKEIAFGLRTKRVFIVLDDVDNDAQIEALAREHNWFGLGSRVLVTSRDMRLLKKFVDEIYDVEGLDYIDALKLFSWNAFRNPYPKECYGLMSKNIVNYAKGLPLALKVYGSFLFNASMDAWESVLVRIKKYPNAEILDKIQISFDGLEDRQKELFLDMACFFKGEIKDYALSRLRALDHYAIDIDILMDKSLITISMDGKFEMHDLLQEMGHRIVDCESPNKRGKRSRLWRLEDIIYVLENNVGTSAIKGIVLKLPLPKSLELSFEAFSNIKNLKMLLISPKESWDIHYFDQRRYHEISEDSKTVKWYGDPSKLTLSNELCFIEWWGYPLESLPTSFQPNNLVELIIPWSGIKVLWKGKKCFDKLKHIDLRHSQKLTQTPNLSGLQSLKVFDATGTAITQFPSFDVSSQKLEVLRMGSSSSSPIDLLLPNSFSSLRSLVELDLTYCNLLDGAFPNDMNFLFSLKKLNLSGNKFTRIPYGIMQLSNLYELKVRDCCELCVLSKLPLGLLSIHVKGSLSLDASCNLVGLLTSSEKLVTGNLSFALYNFGYGGQPHKTIHVYEPNFEDRGRVIFTAIAWGPTSISEIPMWFILRSNSFLGSNQRVTFAVSWDPRISGCAIFIAYEVHKPDSCQSEVKKVELDDHENSRATIFDGNGPNLPVFVCKLLAQESDTVTLAFRVPEVLVLGPNGVWMFINYQTLRTSWVRSRGRINCLGVSIETSIPNVKLKECGARFVLEDELSECFEILNSISSHDLKRKRSEILEGCHLVC